MLKHLCPSRSASPEPVAPVGVAAEAVGGHRETAVQTVEVAAAAEAGTTERIRAIHPRRRGRRPMRVEEDHAEEEVRHGDDGLYREVRGRDAGGGQYAGDQDRQGADLRCKPGD